MYQKTGKLRAIDLPTCLLGIKVEMVRFVNGSLQRYGVKVKEFRLGIGVFLHSCVERVIVVRLNLGSKWSSIYFDNYKIFGSYPLISSVLGLPAYKF